MVKAVLSARDPGAARCMIPLARLWPEAQLVAQEPACSMLQAAGLRPELAPVPVLQGLTDPRAGELLDWARQYLAAHRPEILVTGLSSPGLGLDEALLARAGPIGTFSLQDLDGLVVEGFGKPADTYLVCDSRAAELTRNRVRAIPVGSLKHEGYASLDPLKLRRDGRAGVDGALLTFYGQPAWEWAGYARTLEFLQARIPAGTVRYRPHPKETSAERARTLRMLGASLDPDPWLERSLCATDVALTVSSTCAIDHIYLSRCSPKPLGVAVCALIEPDLRAAFQQDVGRPQPWQLDEGLLLSTLNLQDALCQETALTCWRRIQNTIELPGTAGANALEIIRRVPG